MTLEILPYQLEGAQRLASRSRFGLFDKPGVGKTAQVVRALDIQGARRGIVICPAAVREHWCGEFKKFSHMQRRVCKGKTIHDYVAWSRHVFDVLICSYEMATKWQPYIMAAFEPFDFLVLDEAHYLKSAETSRARKILGEDSDGIGGILSWACSAWWLTGTPIPNDPLDIYTFLRFAAVMPLEKKEFTKRYFHTWQKTYSSEQSPKPEMLPELQRLIGNNSISRTLDQVGIQIPPIFLTSTLVDGDTQHIVDMLRQFPGLDKQIVQHLEQNDGLAGLKAEHVATLRRLIGEAKAVPYAAMLVGELHGGKDKVVTMGIHKQALLTVHRHLAEQGIKSVIINGETNEAGRVEAVRSFMEDPDCRVFLGNIRAAGVGLTLTSACYTDMLESDWTPAGNEQAIKRVHRFGQTRSVMARFITLANSFDETVNEIVAAKTAVIAQIEQRQISA